MYVKRIKFTDFLGNVREQDYRFHLSKAELIDMDLTTKGGIKGLLEGMVDHQDIPELTRFFKEFLKTSYGEISPDGITFDKSEDIWNRFYRSNAYSSLFMELLTDSDAAIDFIQGVIPKDTNEQDDSKLTLMQEAKAKAEERLRTNN